MEQENIEAILISETHWDRAWYRTFQQFRLRLVNLVNELLDILDRDPDFKTFTFDGQTVVIEDYLEMVPHQRERFTNLVKAGRIDIGPWYVLPDVFLVSGEALIRNLLMGRRIGAEFGGVINVGYIPDPFGHVSQIPMILSQFNYNSAIFARGTGNEIDELGAEFIWEASDGSEVLTHWLPYSYGNAARLPEDIDDALGTLDDVVQKLKPWTRIGTVLLMNGSDHVLPQPQVPEVIRTYNEKYDDKIIFGSLPMFIDRISEKKDSLKRFRGEFRRSKYENLLSGVYSTRIYLKQMNEYVQRLLERTVEPWCSVAYALGSPYPRDQITMAWKYLLRNHPHDDICGCSIDEVHDDMVQRFRWVDEIAGALVNDAYDIIVKAHETESTGIVVVNPSPRARNDIVIMELPASDFRYTRLADIQLIDEALEPETALEAAKNEAHINFVKVYGFDLSPSKTREIKIGDELITEFEFDFSALALMFPQFLEFLTHISTAYRIRVNSANQIVEVWARKAYAENEMMGIPSLKNKEGDAVPVQLLSRVTRKDEEARLIADREEFLTIALQVQEIDGLGVLRLELANSLEEEASEVEGAVSWTENTLENNLIKVAASSNGTIQLTDKRNGEDYRGLLEWEDSGDIGDEYDYSPTKSDSTIRSGDMKFDVDVVHTGPLVGSLLISGALEIPLGAMQGSEGCAEETVLCDFTTEVTMHANSPTLNVVTEFMNQAEDHRLRVLFPSGTNAETVFADSAFDFIERPVRPLDDDSDWKQPVAPTYPLRRFVSLYSDTRGLTITTRGLIEFEILEEQGGTIALTTLRSVGWLSRRNLKTRKDAAGPILETPGGQCLGLQIFEYAITPHDGDRSEDILSESEAFLLPLTAILAPGREGAGGIHSTSYLNIEPECIELSAFKHCEDGDKLAIRLWNSSDSEQECMIHLGFDIKKATSARADETPIEDGDVKVKRKRIIKARIKGRGLLTLLLDVQR
ncbi:MAG: alpha-mannosidase [Candidatus Thorarchaeota archaeon]